MSRSIDARTRALVEAPCRVTMQGAANPVEDAKNERRKATFDSEEVARFLHGGEDKLARRWAGQRLGRWRCRRLVPPLAAFPGAIRLLCWNAMPPATLCLQG